VADIGAQHDDYRAAISFARTLLQVDSEQVVVWGSSFSGGHVAALAAEDDRLAGAISQNPFMDGVATLRALGVAATVRLTVAGLRDEWARIRGREAFVIPIVGPPGTTGAMCTPDALPGYSAMYEGSPWVNEYAARVGLRVAWYRPGLRASSIACPWLVQVADDDAITPAAPAVAAAARAPWPKLCRYPGGHFDVYVGQGFERAVGDQVDFLRRVVPVHSTVVAVS
jgi:pimeloyl-ACP methyl ester carboxylesterase